MNSRVRKKKFYIPLLLIFCSFFSLFLTLEIAVRVKNALKPTELSPEIERDAKRGWRTRPNFHYQGTKKDAGGLEHNVEITTDPNGFRAFGNTTSTRCRVLFIGDSFTFAKDVTQSAPFYAVAGSILDLEVFAYGADGYNTLQEYLVLDEWLDQIQPDVIVWQLCWNDFIGNSLELTRGSAKNQCHTPQPFLAVDGSIEYRNPGDGRFSRLIHAIPSRFLHSIAYRLDNRKGFPATGNTIENIIETKGGAFGPFQQAVKTTDLLLKKVQIRCNTIPLLAFNVSAKPPYADAFRNICAKHGITLLEEIPNAIQQADAKGTVVFAEDGGHWNPAGHRICGEILAQTLRPRCKNILPK